MIKKIFGLFTIPFLYFCAAIIIKYTNFFTFSIELLFLITIIVFFIASHFFFDIRNMYYKIFKYRYYIGILLLIVLVVGKYHGSSLNYWNTIIQPGIPVEDSEVIIGEIKSIRSDEWLVTTPHLISQTTETVNFSPNNTLMRGTDNNVTLFPRLPVKDIFMLAYPNTWGFLFLDNEMAFSFDWYILYFALFFVSIEFFMILTNKNKVYSVLGAFLIAISPAVFWWNSPKIALYGQLALVIIHKFMITESQKSKLGLSVILGIVASAFVLCLYPAWQVTYGYCFLMIFVWMLVKNFKKIQFKDLYYLLLAIIICVSLVLPLIINSLDVIEIMNNTSYPGDREITQVGSWEYIFTYPFNLFYTFFNIGNASEFSQYISLYPLPMIVSLILIAKNKGKDLLLNLLAGLIVFYTIWITIPLPSIISTITLLSFTTLSRMAPVINYISVILMVYILSNYEKEIKLKKYKNIILVVGSLIFSGLIVMIGKDLHDMNEFKSYFTYVSFVFFFVTGFLFLLNSKKTNILLVVLLILMTTFSSIFVWPLSKGYSVIAEKPFALEIQKIVQEEPGALFLGAYGGNVIGNYLLANGARTINSTNFIPNLELWSKLDPTGQYEEIYNRYSHIVVEFSEKESYFELLQFDAIKLYISQSDVCEIGIDYVASLTKLEGFENYLEVYNENGTYIYIINCDN